MIVAVTAKGTHLSDEVDPRFGRAPYILLVDTETMQYEALDNSSNVNAFKGAGIQAATMVADKGAKVLLTGQGVDEILTGYHRNYKAFSRNNLIQKLRAEMAVSYRGWPLFTWDVIDEAGQCHPAYAISALYRAQRALVIGDLHQLEPVIELDATEEARVLKRLGGRWGFQAVGYDGSGEPVCGGGPCAAWHGAPVCAPEHSALVRLFSAPPLA